MMLCLVATIVDQQRRLGSLPCRSTRWGLDRSPRLTDLLDGDLVGKWARERFMGLALGTRQKPPNLRVTSWSRLETFLLGIKKPCVHASTSV
jgi:hypothetical protein